MVGRTNVGGGGAAAWAYIGVTYPAGSSCTATSGSTTLTADGTSGLYVFQIPQPSTSSVTWTVSCTNGTKSKSTTVTLNARYQCATVTLSYIRVPEEYQEIEYIQNTGYNTLEILPQTVIWQSNWEADLEYIIPATKAAGGANSETNTLYYLGIGYSDTIAASSVSNGVASVNYSINLYDSVSIVSNVPANTKITAIWNNASHKVLHNGTVVRTLSTDDYPNQSTPSYMWAGCYSLLSNTTSNRNLEGRVCSFKVKNTSNNTLVYDFVPCKLKSNNYLGLYDLVSNSFTQISASEQSKFVGGPEVL